MAKKVEVSRNLLLIALLIIILVTILGTYSILRAIDKSLASLQRPIIYLQPSDKAEISIYILPSNESQEKEVKIITNENNKKGENQ